MANFKVKLMVGRKICLIFPLFAFLILSLQKSLVLAQVWPSASPVSSNLSFEKRRSQAVLVAEKEKQLNQKTVKAMSQSLERLELILQKAESRAKKMAVNQAEINKIYPLIENLKISSERLKNKLSQQLKKNYSWPQLPPSEWRREAERSHLSLSNELGDLNNELFKLRREVNQVVQTLVNFL
jgi:hypothetical protein